MRIEDVKRAAEKGTSQQLFSDALNKVFLSHWVPKGGSLHLSTIARLYRDLKFVKDPLTKAIQFIASKRKMVKGDVGVPSAGSAEAFQKDTAFLECLNCALDILPSFNIMSRNLMVESEIKREGDAYFEELEKNVWSQYKEIFEEEYELYIANLGRAAVMYEDEDIYLSFFDWARGRSAAKDTLERLDKEVATKEIDDEFWKELMGRLVKLYVQKGMGTIFPGMFMYGKLYLPAQPTVIDDKTRQKITTELIAQYMRDRIKKLKSQRGVRSDVEGDLEGAFKWPMQYAPGVRVMHAKGVFSLIRLSMCLAYMRSYIDNFETNAQVSIMYTGINLGKMAPAQRKMVEGESKRKFSVLKSVLGKLGKRIDGYIGDVRADTLMALKAYLDLRDFLTREGREVRPIWERKQAEMRMRSRQRAQMEKERAEKGRLGEESAKRKQEQRKAA